MDEGKKKKRKEKKQKKKKKKKIKQKPCMRTLMYLIQLDIYLHAKTTEEMPTSSATVWKVRGGSNNSNSNSNSNSIVSESGHPTRESVNTLQVPTFLIRAHLQLQPLPSTEDQMFWHCTVWTMYQEGSTVRLQSRPPESTSHKRVSQRTHQPKELSNIKLSI